MNLPKFRSPIHAILFFLLLGPILRPIILALDARPALKHRLAKGIGMVRWAYFGLVMSLAIGAVAMKIFS